MDWIEPSKEDVYQRLRNFDSVYFPDNEKRSQLLDDRTLVNTFRTVFNTYFGSEYEILEDKMYWSKNQKPYLFKDVTHYVIDP